MKKVTLIALVGLFFAHNSAMATKGEEQGNVFRSTRVLRSHLAKKEDSLTTYEGAIRKPRSTRVLRASVEKVNSLTAYERAVRKLRDRVNNINSTSDLRKIRKTAKLALYLQPKRLKSKRMPLDLYARFGTGLSQHAFLRMSRITLDLIHNGAPERKIHSAIIAALILAPRDIEEHDFNVLQPALWKH
jgi:hypothetical protein